MKMGYPMLDPERDLEGATPEKLARALLRPKRQRPDQPVGVREQPEQYANNEESGKRYHD